MDRLFILQLWSIIMQKWSNPITKRYRIAFLLFDRFSNLCLANCLEPMRAVNDFAGASVFEWGFYTTDGTSVQSSSHLPIIPHGSADAIPENDYLFVLSSYGYRDQDTAQIRAQLRKAAQRSQMLVGLDTAPWLLASAGLLQGCRATVHWDVLQDFAERFLDCDSVRHRVVWDGNRITCAGAMSAFDLTRDIIRRHLGTAMALDVDALFLRDNPDAQTPRRYDPIRPSSVQRAISLMQANMEHPLTLDQIADKIACPRKTLSRRFQSAMGASPGQVYRHIRLTHARQLIETTALNIYEVALRCGYDSPAALTRAYKTRFAQTPTGTKRATRIQPAQD